MYLNGKNAVVTASSKGLSNTLRSGVVGLMKTLSLEFARENILVNTVCPGRIMTDRIVELDSLSAERDQVTLEQVQQTLAEDIPLGRYGETQELASIAAFLLSPRNSYIRFGVLCGRRSREIFIVFDSICRIREKRSL